MRSTPRVLACHVRVFHFRAPASPAQPPNARLGRRGPSPATSCGSHCILGGGFGRGAKPPSEWNVQRVRLACGPRAPPCSWTLLIALAGAFLRQALSRTGSGFDFYTIGQSVNGRCRLGRPCAVVEESKPDPSLTRPPEPRITSLSMVSSPLPL